MTEFRPLRAGQLSGGMKQKLGLTCALVHAPKILLLDEPTTGVDPVSRRDFWGILYGLREEGVTILISTAYLDEAERCNRLALLHRGRALYCDTPAALKERMPGALLAITSPRAGGARRAGGPARRAATSFWSATAFMRSWMMPICAFPNCETRWREPASPAPTSQSATPSIEDVFVALAETGERT